MSCARCLKLPRKRMHCFPLSSQEYEPALTKKHLHIHIADTKGNSLFGEVADQRNKLLTIFSKMKTSYNKLKLEHANCPRQIQQLRYMSQQSERLYRQCINLIEYDRVITLKEQNGELHE
uniref:Uncharacterized protein n=1 Tax=Anopheles stephensi TaxID=30069 RepID=A0A182YR61_ANOST